MTHYLPRAETKKTSHVMSTDCPCKPKLRGVFEGTWKNMVGLALDHQLI